MPSHEYVTVDVFTDRRFAGNPLAVLPDARGLDEGQMQAIAAEFNYSETTFVLPPDDPRHHARVRIFSSQTELPFAGHPNVGTAFVLAQGMDAPPEHFTFEEAAGLVRVHLLRDPGTGAIGGARVAAPRSLSLGDAVPVELVAACASLPESAIATGAHAPLVASVGMEFVIAEVADEAALARAEPDIGAFRLAASRLPHVKRMALHLYTWLDTDTRRLRARMFSPLIGVLEDPATGSANAALAALLTSLAPGSDVSLDYAIEQGIEMGRPSLILGSARKEAEGPVTASVGGGCVMVRRGRIEV